MSNKDDVKLAISDHNLQVISTDDYAKVLACTMQSSMNIAIFGRRGSGKTEIAKQVIANVDLDNVVGKKAREIYINLSVAERTDMGGYPDMFGIMQNASDAEKRQRFVDYVLPKFYEAMMEGDQDVVAVFDEVDKADPSIWAPMLEILQFKSINHKPLKNLRSCVLTGNLISEGSQRPSLPLLDRAEKYLLRADASSFLSWAARSNKIHPSIRAFLQDHPQYLYGTNDGAGDLYAEPSPRSWENASRAVTFGEKHGWDKDLMNLKVSGFVGKEAGLKYLIYFEHYRELLPMIDALFDGKDIISEYKSKDPGKQIYAAMIICARLAGLLDQTPYNGDASQSVLPEEVKYFGHFMQKAVSDENTLISVRTQITIDRIIKWDLDSNPDLGNLLNIVTENINKD